MSDALPNPFIDDLAAAAQALRDALKDEDPRIRIYAARSITLAATHIQRTNAYLERCKVLNDRAARTPASTHKDSSVSPPCNSVPSVVNDDFVPTKGDPKKKKPFGAQLSPGDTDPHTGWVVPEEHICQIRKDAPENHVMAHCMLPGYKTKADLERAVYTFIDRDNRIYNELKAAQSELNVFRSERLGSITLEKREELLAGRFEKNNKRREVYGTPTFLAELPQLTPELLAAKPVPPLEELLAASTPYPDRQGGGSSPSTPLSSTSVSASLVSQHHSPAFSAPSPCPSVNSVVNEVLSEKAAARRAAGKRPLPPITPRLNHPTPATRNSS